MYIAFIMHALIKVPATSLNTYKTASGWKDYTGKIVANAD
jgi:hypothetical protein